MSRPLTFTPTVHATGGGRCSTATRKRVVLERVRRGTTHYMERAKCRMTGCSYVPTTNSTQKCIATRGQPCPLVHSGMSNVTLSEYDDLATKNHGTCWTKTESTYEPVKSVPRPASRPTGQAYTLTRTTCSSTRYYSRNSIAASAPIVSIASRQRSTDSYPTTSQDC
jgi:hypothetical protein